MKNKINITATETRNCCLSAFDAQHILDHNSCRTEYIQLGKDIAPHKISVKPMQRQIKTHTA